MSDPHNIFALATDRQLLTNEIHTPNDFYGHATILKKYAGCSPDYQIKAAIEHSPYFTRSYWAADINAPLPAIFASAPHRVPHLRKACKKQVFTLGPLIHYASPFLSSAALNRQKKKLGKNLLVFPAHSTHHIDAHYDIHKFCRQFEKFSKNFDSIRICLYWKDVLRGAADAYLQHGFECVTAGHIYDPLFLNRLKSIIELSTITISNTISTHIGYCIMLNKPHCVIKCDDYRLTALNDTGLKNLSEHLVGPSDDVYKLFFQFRDNITTQQLAFVRNYWGLDEIKTPEQLNSIFKETEIMYQNLLTRMSPTSDLEGITISLT